MAHWGHDRGRPPSTSRNRFGRFPDVLAKFEYRRQQRNRIPLCLRERNRLSRCPPPLSYPHPRDTSALGQPLKWANPSGQNCLAERFSEMSGIPRPLGVGMKGDLPSSKGELFPIANAI